MELITSASIERVSTSRQTTEHLAMATDLLADKHGLNLAYRFTLKTSASKGNQQGVLDDVRKLAAEGRIGAVAVPALDRIDRRGIAYLKPWVWELVKLGVRIYSARQGEEWLSDLDPNDLLSDIRLGVEADRARAESEIRTNRVNDAYRVIDSMGSMRFRAPRGWTVSRPVKYQATVEADEASQQLVRSAIEAIAAGATVAETARKSGVAYGTIELWLRTDAYVTGLVPAGPGRWIEMRPFIPADIMAQARSRHSARRSQRRETLTRTPKSRDAAATLSGRLYCPHGNALHVSYGPKRKDGSRRTYYRAARCQECRSRLYDQLQSDAAASEFLGASTYRMTVTRIPGLADTTLRLAKIEQERQSAVAERNYQRAQQLDAEADALNRKLLPVTTEAPPLGEEWASMDHGERRRWLAQQADQYGMRLVVHRDGYRIELRIGDGSKPVEASDVAEAMRIMST